LIALTVRVAVPDPVTLCGLIFAAKPGDELVVRKTVPENPFRAVTDIEDVPNVLSGTLI